MFLISNRNNKDNKSINNYLSLHEQKERNGKMKKTLVIMAALCLAMTVGAKVKKEKISIVFIGNSITQGVKLKEPKMECPPAQCVEFLKAQEGIELMGYSNNGVSGKTTYDFLPATGTFFNKVTAKADSLYTLKGKLVFSMMLGTNDSAVKGPHGAPVSGAQYFTNMRSIIDELMERYPKALFILHQPTWYSLNTYNTSMYLREGLERLHGYTAQLEKLVEHYAKKNPNHVFMGDTDAYSYFEKNYLTDFTPEEGKAGTFYLHPNAKGAKALGEFWGKAVKKVLTAE